MSGESAKECTDGVSQKGSAIIIIIPQMAVRLAGALGSHAQQWRVAELSCSGTVDVTGQGDEAVAEHLKRQSFYKVANIISWI
jgi:hypothetical protein